MRLLVRPYSLWLAYDITQPNKISKMLPPHLELTSVPILQRDQLWAPKLLMNAYDVESLWMRGHRVEIQTIARDKNKHTTHFVVLQCLSNVNLWDPIRGLAPSNARCVSKHTSSSFHLKVSTKGQDFTYENREVLCVSGNLCEDKENVSKKFVVDSNRQCYYGSYPRPFSLSFDERQVLQPVRCLASTGIVNTLWSTVRKARPSHAFVHDQSMTYDVDVTELWYDIF